MIATRNRRGIIPARAGFTGPVVGRSPPPGDHPRSRGVYAARTRRSISHPGSSPLARGLRGGVAPRVLLAGIIPARAGFTGDPAQEPPVPGDHPRSRGVYIRGGHRPDPRRGSSPLARGLHRLLVRQDPHRRIIPARAGFTRRLDGGRHGRRDHPRSRGVYPFSRVSGGQGRGSSPLARGLPRVGPGPAGWPGIIPARAGFTVCIPPEPHHE